jgi:hypothetical protein
VQTNGGVRGNKPKQCATATWPPAPPANLKLTLPFFLCISLVKRAPHAPFFPWFYYFLTRQIWVLSTWHPLHRSAIEYHRFFPYGLLPGPTVMLQCDPSRWHPSRQQCFTWDSRLLASLICYCLVPTDYWVLAWFSVFFLYKWLSYCDSVVD